MLAMNVTRYRVILIIDVEIPTLYKRFRHLNDKFVACRSFNFNCPGVVFWRTAERTQVAVIYGVDVATMYKNYLQGEHKHHSESSIFLEQC
ncbi:hypothetical protein AL515_12925 [Citrobacter sp. FDAARGOS_156]|nr:hypothetical protein AL515_12925 [Citrobacter sp. FDAARGOS_156]